MSFNVPYIFFSVSADKDPLILVLMNHSYEPQCVTTQKTWPDYPNIKMFVHVFYHDSMDGLIKCHENEDAVEKMAAFCAEIVQDNSYAEPACENKMDRPVEDSRSNKSDKKSNCSPT